jgi:hypothetical protein
MKYYHLRASPTVALYFGTINGAASVLYSYSTRGAQISSIGDAKLQRAHRGQNCSSTGRCKLERAAPMQTIFSHFYRINKIKQTQINHQ